jgi:hypothetical protein
MVMVFTENSNSPFKLEYKLDLSRLIAYFGQLRDRLVVLLADKHERIVPGIMQWELKQWEVNKDVKVDYFDYISNQLERILYALLRAPS